MSKRKDIIKLIEGKSDSELNDIICQNEKYNKDLVEVSFEELEKRGLITEEIEEIKKQFFSYKDVQKAKIETNITEDLDAPLLYKQRHILIYGTLFSIIGASILMAINLWQIGKNKAVYFVILVGVLLNVIQILIHSLFEGTNVLYIVVSGILFMSFLNLFFWNSKDIKELKYRKRSFKVPIIVLFSILIPLSLLIMIGVITDFI